jgi:hypothetical protein
LLNKYPDILTPEEKAKMDRLKDFVLFGVCSGVIAMPYSIYLGMKARRNPANRKLYLRRMIFIPLIPLVIVTIAGSSAEQNLQVLSKKYFGHLSDYDLDNFETYYHMMRSGMPTQAMQIQPPAYA